MNNWRTFILRDDAEKGFEVQYTFEIDGHTEDCNQNEIVFREEQGGMQEVIALAQFQNGLYN